MVTEKYDGSQNCSNQQLYSICQLCSQVHFIAMFLWQPRLLFGKTTKRFSCRLGRVRSGLQDGGLRCTEW